MRNPGDTYRDADHGELVDVVLMGGPPDVPEQMRVPNAMVAAGKVKIERHGGYDHYERADGARDALTFSWTSRTKIAE